MAKCLKLQADLTLTPKSFKKQMTIKFRKPNKKSPASETQILERQWSLKNLGINLKTNNIS